MCAGEMAAITYANSSRAESKSESEESEAAASLSRFRLRAARRSARTCSGGSSVLGPLASVTCLFFPILRPLFGAPTDFAPTFRLEAWLGWWFCENKPIVSSMVGRRPMGPEWGKKKLFGPP